MSSKEYYFDVVREQLKKELGLSSVMAVPNLKKITVNTGFGTKRENKKYVAEIKEEMATITGQAPKAGRARLSISNFKLREGHLIGYSVTLRGQMMWDFYNKFVNIVLPRVKDFRGVSEKSFDDAGNYSIGVLEHTVFPEIDANKIQFIKPLQVVITTSAKNKEEGYALLKNLGMPFRKK